MPVSLSTALLIILLVILSVTRAHRTHDNRHLNREVRPRRHETEERSSGRRWTTSRNSPYQKIVSSYEQELPVGENDDLEDDDQVKTKNYKRKQWRTSATSHDQIPSETSSVGESDKNQHEFENHEHENDSFEQNDQPVSEVPSKSVISRRRTTTSTPKQENFEAHLDISTPNPKKRRRLPSTSTTTTLSPQTMSDSLYHHFQPLDQNVPQDDIIPFLDFGRKLSPVIPTPSGANSIESRTTVTKLRPRTHHEEKESNLSDEEMLQEDMDVTVVKKAIERNSVPRAKLRVREQGISDFYRKRNPAQVRTTENQIITSDSSTASSVPESKTVIILKKGNRHQTHASQFVKLHEKNPSSLTDLHNQGNVEILPKKKTELSSIHIDRTAALIEETHHSPLTAESSLVKTVIKEVPTSERNIQLEFENHNTTNTPTTITTPTTTTPLRITVHTETTVPTSTTTEKDTSTQTISFKEHTLETLAEPSNDTKENSKILSTAVVTSVSIEGSDQSSEAISVLESSEKDENKTKSNNSVHIANAPVTQIISSPMGNSSFSNIPVKSVLHSRNSSLNTSNDTTSAKKNTTSNEPKITPVRNDTSLRSRDIYRPKAIPPGLNIHHLPRQIPFNLTRKTNSQSTTNATLISSSTFKPNTTASTLPTTIRYPVRVSSSSTEATVATTSQNTGDMTNTKSTPTKNEPETETHVSSTNNSRVEEKIPENRSNKSLSSLNTTEKGISYITESQSNLRSTQSPNNTQEETSSHVDEDEQSSQSVESESAPPPKFDKPAPVNNLTFVPASPEETQEDLFPIYFTTLPAPTIPVVDTRPTTRMRPRPGSETAVVRQHRNLTSPRAGVGVGADWVKVGAVDKDVEVVYPESLGVGAYLLAGLGVVPIILGALVGARFILAHNRKKVLDESEYSSEYNRSPLGASTASPLPTKLPRIPTHVGWSETEKSVPLPTIAPVTSQLPGTVCWEFPRDKLRLQTLLGQGNFGQVWKAEADDIAGHEGLTRLVAVKTVKESANIRERQDLLRELGIMQELGSHPNVVTLLGCCTEKEPIYLIMEYVMYGKLLSFLRDRRTRSHYYNFSDATDALTSRDLTVFAYCVARGMDYLTNKSIIHRDIAARNVLVDHNKLCKIADFGMSRNVRDTGQIYEQRQSKGALPIRWMAPESLHFSLFTHKTDVWSFGILMWEIVTLGSTPYATMGAREVMRRVRDGYRLDRPSHCRPELFRIIAQCWHSEPSRRPTFAELKAELALLLSDKELNGSFVDLESYADEMRRDSLHRHH